LARLAVKTGKTMDEIYLYFKKAYDGRDDYDLNRICMEVCRSDYFFWEVAYFPLRA
jgi:hypothetical protein